MLNLLPSSLRGRKIPGYIRVFLGLVLIFVVYRQLKSSFGVHKKVVTASHVSGDIIQAGIARSLAKEQLKKSESKHASQGQGDKLSRTQPKAANIYSNAKVSGKRPNRRRSHWPREDVQQIEDLRYDAYDEAETAEFKKKLKDMNTNLNRFTKGAEYNKTDEVVTVILMPHSHNDPGWLWTYDMYYNIRTSTMFNNLVHFLQTEDDDMPFHWSESVSLLRWYKSASDISRNVIKSAICDQRMLMDHGSWSMPDEASTSIYSLVENLILGHQWVNNEFNVKPEFSWANDPFGHSSTIPYLLKECGLKAMVINRIDMILKKEMREKQMLEFYWRHQGREDDSTDMFTHVLPHALYNTRESFGPDLNLAKKYDFSPPEMQYSPLVGFAEGELLVDVNTVKKRAQLLAEQVHHRSAYFKHNVILSPIGDDFRYIEYTEFQGVQKNWAYLQKYYSEHPELKVKLQFGTLADYFRLVEQHAQLNSYPVLSGDFFSYADNSDFKPVDAEPANSDSSPIYWTGYFTTRPAFKIGLRRLETLLRQTEILYSQYKLESNSAVAPFNTSQLSAARETLSWLLHHDAITGTSPPNTMHDFTHSLEAATHELELFSTHVMRALTDASSAGMASAKNHLTSSAENVVLDTSAHHLVIDGSGHSDDKVVEVSTGSIQTLTLSNSLLHRVETVAHVKLLVAPSTSGFSLVDSSANPVACQINPFFNLDMLAAKAFRELAFHVSLPPLGRQSYTLSTGGKGPCQLATVMYHVLPGNSLQSIDNLVGFNPGMVETTHTPVIELKTELNQIHVSPINGSLLAMSAAGEVKVKSVVQSFGLYNKGDTNRNLENGIYMFTATNEGVQLTNLSTPTPVVTLRGNVELVAVSIIDKVSQSLRINNFEHGVAMTQGIQLGKTPGDLFTRIRSDINNRKIYYTDSNSFTMTKRVNEYPKRPIAYNYYPITSSVYLEGDNYRLTLLTGHPVGATSLHQGEIEVMLDRRHESHDHAGVNDGLTDNNAVIAQFRLIAETVNNPARTAALTTLSLHHSLKHSYPLLGYLGKVSSSADSNALLPCDYHLVTFRSLDTLPFGKVKEADENSLALVLQRFATVEGGVGMQDHVCYKRNKAELHLPPGYVVEKTSLSLLYGGQSVDPSSISLEKTDSLQTFKISKQ